MSAKTGGVAVRDGFDPAPAMQRTTSIEVTVASAPPATAGAVGLLVGTDGPVAAELGLDRDALAAAGFTGAPGQSLVVPRAGSAPLVAVGVGPVGSLTADGLRDAAGAFARAAGPHAALALVVPAFDGVPVPLAGQVVTEGVILARYRYTPLVTDPGEVALTSVVLVGDDALAEGAGRGQILATACAVSRDLANCPPTSPRARWRRWPSASVRRRASASRCSTSPPSGSWAAAGCSG
jgi:leucyl aminopeptidase